MADLRAFYGNFPHWKKCSRLRSVTGLKGERGIWKRRDEWWEKERELHFLHLGTQDLCSVPKFVVPLLDAAYLIQEKKVKTEHVCNAHYVSKYFKMSNEVQAILRVEE